MADKKCYRLEGAINGEWPDDHPIQVGTIVRPDLSKGQWLTMNAWNSKTRDWVAARWVEVPDPALTPKGN